MPDPTSVQHPPVPGVEGEGQPRVVPMHDGIAPEGIAYTPVVERLIELLIQARRGEILALAYGVVRPNGDGSHGFEYPDGRALQMAGVVLALSHGIGEALTND